jgi:uncharacterized damage-inducible protein DinB
MNGVIKYFAKCNKHINNNLIEILRSNDIFNKELVGYYKKINDILFHILVVDLSWTNDLKGIIKSEIFNDVLYKDFNENINESFYKSVIDFEKDRNHLDDLLIKFVNDIKSDDLEKIITYKNNSIKKVWQVLVHIFNHQTHHRGQISEILDENGIENDYSNMIRYDI